MNFDKVIQRKGTDSAKWDIPGCEKIEDLIPMGIADTDFKAPEIVLSALRKVLDHGVIGYGQSSQEHLEAIRSLYANFLSFNFSRDAISFFPGVVPIIVASLLAFTEEGDEVIVQYPCYPPIINAIKQNRRKVLKHSLIYDKSKGHYYCDFDSVEKQITERTKAWIICNPHNPTGKVYSRQELTQIANLADKYDFIMISDEIHGGLNFNSNPYTPLAAVSEEAEKRTIIATSPGKVFDVAGLIFSFSIVPNPILREKLDKEAVRLGYVYAMRNTIGLTAVKALYQEEVVPWIRAKRTYIEDNFLYLKEFLSINLAKIEVTQSEGTFLVWLDFSALNLTGDQVVNIFVNTASIVISSGKQFGDDYASFVRMNIGCPRSILQEALERMTAAFTGY